MKKTIIKTALISFGAALVLAITIFGIVSFCFPYVMVDFTSSIGMKTLSGDYSYQEYRRSGDIDSLARSFVIAAEQEHDRSAENRFAILYGEDGSEERAKFDEHFAAYEVDYSETKNVGGSMRSYLLGLASCVKFRSAKTSEEKREAAISFAIENTDESFAEGNPVIYLAVEAVEKQDADFCGLLLKKIKEKNFDKTSKDYNDIVKMLEGAKNE